jgi:hypothetical protein
LLLGAGLVAHLFLCFVLAGLSSGKAFFQQPPRSFAVMIRAQRAQAVNPAWARPVLSATVTLHTLRPCFRRSSSSSRSSQRPLLIGLDQRQSRVPVLQRQLTKMQQCSRRTILRSGWAWTTTTATRTTARAVTTVLR